VQKRVWHSRDDTKVRRSLYFYTMSGEKSGTNTLNLLSNQGQEKSQSTKAATPAHHPAATTTPVFSFGGATPTTAISNHPAATTTPVFSFVTSLTGQPAATSSSGFGKSIFGQPGETSLTGQPAATSSSGFDKSIFGQPGETSLTGQPAATSSSGFGKSIFGQPGETSLTGQPAATSSSGFGKSIFGQPGETSLTGSQRQNHHLVLQRQKKLLKDYSFVV
jgi:hypothetical protein